MPDSTHFMNQNYLSPALQSWYNQGEMRTLNDQSIFTIDDGSKNLPVLVLVHGFPTSSWDFQQMWSTLGKQYRLITMDMLGFGFSDKPNLRNYTIHKQVDLFIQLLHELGITKYDMLTHDYGVSVSQEMLARQKQGTVSSHCKSCCFLNGGLFPETHKALFVQKLLLGPLGKYANRLLGYPMFKKSFSQVFGERTKPSEQELAQFWELINYNDGRHLFHNLITYMLDRREHRERWLKALQQSDIPLALINGSVDPVSGGHLVARYQELGCRLDYLKEFEDLGHYPHCENADAVSQAYLEFRNHT